jgi:hypothetical protein
MQSLFDDEFRNSFLSGGGIFSLLADAGRALRFKLQAHRLLNKQHAFGGQDMSDISQVCRRRFYKGDQQPSWSLAVQAQTDCSSYPKGMPCTTQGSHAKSKEPETASS